MGTTFKPATANELARRIAAAGSPGEKLGPVDLTALDRVLEYTPEDMTVTVETGITLAALQRELGRHRQWLPLDPPHAARLTIADLINANLSGPRRFGCGTVRDHLIGIRVALADGTVICSGGKVVKNVAGYDLARLFIGSHGSLGLPLAATFKLRPLPESERFVQASGRTWDEADKLIETVMASELAPVVCDLHSPGPEKNGATLVLGFAGSREEVEWQLQRASEFGINEASSLDYSEKFWSEVAPPRRLSVLPSKMMAAIRGLDGAAFVARAANGVIYHRGEASPPRNDLPLELMRRLKEAYDPRHIFPELPL